MTILKKIATGCAAAVIVGFGALTGAQASTLDFTTATYASTFGQNVVTDTVDGVNFTITATAYGSDGFRQANGGGLSFGRPGNGMTSLLIQADQQVTFNSMTGRGHGLAAPQLPFIMGYPGTQAQPPVGFASAMLETVSFPIDPNATSPSGLMFIFGIDLTAPGGSSILSSALIRSFDFTVANAVSAVPLPAGLALMFTGLGFLGFAGRRKKTA